MSAGPRLLVAVLLLLGNAFFVGAEFALVSARRTQIEPRAEAGSRVARTTLRAMENISLVIGVNQLGITVCSLVLGAVGEPAVAHLIEPVLHVAHVPEAFLHPAAFVLGLALVVYLHVVMGEMIPKNIALAGPDRAALVLGPAIWAIVTVLRPVIVGDQRDRLGGAAAGGVELMDEVSSTYTREEVAALVEESRGEGLLEADEYDRLAGALGFTEKTVASVLMPSDTLTVLPGLHPGRRRGPCARRPGSAASRSRPRPATCSATCTSRTCSSPTRPGAASRWTTSGSVRSPTSRARTPCTTPSRPSSAGAPTWRASWTAEGADARPGDPRGRHRGAGRRDPRRGPPRGRPPDADGDRRGARAGSASCPIGCGRHPPETERDAGDLWRKTRRATACGHCPTCSACCGWRASRSSCGWCSGPRRTAGRSALLVVSGVTDFLDG